MPGFILCVLRASVVKKIIYGRPIQIYPFDSTPLKTSRIRGGVHFSIFQFFFSNFQIKKMIPVWGVS